MRLNNKRGLTAMVDAMIFIVVMGLAVAAIFAFSGDDHTPNDASSITDNIFSAKLKACDLVDTEESGLISIPDMVAFHIIISNGMVIDYIESILDSVMQRPDSYRLDVSYHGETISIGSGRGDPVSSSAKEFTVTYGGVIETYLSLY